MGTDQENIVLKILKAIGEDPKREGLRKTPSRVVKAWTELYGGYKLSPKDILSTRFIDGACDEVVLLKNIHFANMCEHHMLPFVGMAHIAYIPNGHVVGLSKLARLTDCFSKRLQIQEKMTAQIADSIEMFLEPKGVAVIVEAHHQCMSCRGVSKQGTTMVTSAIRGVFRESVAARAEVFQLIKS